MILSINELCSYESDPLNYALQELFFIDYAISVYMNRISSAD
jgi:hypothetical protein